MGALDAVPSHIAVLDGDGTIVAVNQAWRAFGAANGYATGDDCVGQNYLAVCDESARRGDADAAAVAMAIRQAASGAPTALERRYPCHSETELRWFLVRVASFEDRGCRRVIVSHEDISPIVQADAARDRADRAREHFLSLVSHELRTPITMIYGNARILRDRGDTIDRASGAEAIADVETEATRLRRLVDNMLALSRLEQDTDVVIEPTLVRPAIDAVVTKWRRVHPLRRFVVDLEEPLPPMSADSPATELVLDNLISNACESSPNDVAIEVEAHAVRDAVAVSVSDRGAGLAAGEEEAIFEAFRRGVHKERFATGVGIGLTACRRLVEAMHGTIWAARRDGGGTQVTFVLPAAAE
jgi:signal transduction histidine kinase